MFWMVLVCWVVRVGGVLVVFGEDLLVLVAELLLLTHDKVSIVESGKYVIVYLSHDRCVFVDGVVDSGMLLCVEDSRCGYTQYQPTVYHRL